MKVRPSGCHLGLRMRIRVLNNTLFKIIISIAIFSAAFLALLSCGNKGAWEDYEYISGREDDVFIRKDNSTVVFPTIIDIETHGENIIGLRLEALNAVCEEGESASIMIKNNRGYFILNSKAEQVLEFNDKASFEKQLAELNLLNKSNLNHSLFDEVWSRYKGYYDSNKVYYDSCKLEKALTQN